MVCGLEDVILMRAAALSEKKWMWVICGLSVRYLYASLMPAMRARHSPSYILLCLPTPNETSAMVS